MTNLAIRTALPKSKMHNLRLNPKTGRWEYRVRLVRPDGSTFQRAGSAATESEARSKRDRAYVEFNSDQGEAKESAKVVKATRSEDLSTFTEFALGKLDIAPTSHAAYRLALKNHILPKLGKLAIDAIGRTDVQDLLDVLIKTESVGVATQARNALVAIMEIAVKRNLLTINTAKQSEISKQARKVARRAKAANGDPSKRILSQAEGSKLLESASGTEAYMPILLGLKFGLRSGEAMGLLWDDIKLDSRLVDINKQAVTIKGETRHICDPKSASGFRKLPIADNLVEELALLKAAATARGETIVCLDSLGKPHHPVHVNRVTKAAVLAAGFDGKDGLHVPTSHDFRSSYLTWLANYANNGAGVKPHVLMKLAGHSDINTTLAYYVTASDDDIRAAVNSL